MFASPNPADVEAKAISSISLETDSMSIDNNKAKSKNATPGSSPRDSMSQDDSSEENNKKLGNSDFLFPSKDFSRYFPMKNDYNFLFNRNVTFF